jgi:putative peptidoglycan lipid II flippase
VGLLVDLGSRKRIDEVRVVVAGGPTDLEIRTSDRYGDRLSTFELLGRDTNVDGPFRLHPAAPVRARYVLVWLTQLPAVEGGYRGEVAKVLLRGG